MRISAKINKAHKRYLYRGYLQLACVDLTRSGHPSLRLITWYTCGHDLTKNVTELYNTTGNIATAYDYTPFGQVTAAGINQPFQWSSEFYDSELGLVYYNYRHYNPKDGRWINRDPIAEMGGWNLYEFIRNNTMIYSDIIGLITPEQIADCLSASVKVEKPAWGRWANGKRIRLTPGKAVRLKRGEHTMIVVDWKDGEECCKIKEEYERKKMNSVSAKMLELKPDRSDQDADDNQLPTRCFPGNVTGATVGTQKSM